MIHAILGRSRALMMSLVLIIIMGIGSYISIPKESEPDVKIPYIYVSVALEGISPEDGERLLLRPLENELQGIEGLKKMTSHAADGYSAVLLEFSAGFDSDKALSDVREKVDEAKVEFPSDAKEPNVMEFNASLFPVVNVILLSEMDNRQLQMITRNLRDKIEGLSQVLEAKIRGDREELLVIEIDPRALEAYNISISEVLGHIQGNNVLVAAGAVIREQGRFAVEVPGLIEEYQDLLNLPLKRTEDAVIRLKDVTEIKNTYKDPQGFARVNGRNALVIEVVKRTGENIIETVEAVKEVVAEQKRFWPEGAIDVMYAQDKSSGIIDILKDLQNNIILAVLLVLVVIIFAMGVRSALLVAITVPGAFLFGIMLINMLGMTLNIVVLFSLILSVGMLVDAAIVVCEYADRKMMEGKENRQAYPLAVNKMALPVIVSTITTLMAFAPLLFWPGVVGQFMLYMPLTLILTLTGSLLMALVFIPRLGMWFGRAESSDKMQLERAQAIESGDLSRLSGFSKSYADLLYSLLKRPFIVLFGMLGFLALVISAFVIFSKGVEFFPDIEPENAQVIIHARGNYSVYEQDRLVKSVEERILDMNDDIRVFYSSTGYGAEGNRDYAEDVIGVITVEFSNWRLRPSADDILDEIDRRTADIPGIIVETRKQESGPPTGKAVQLEFRSPYTEPLQEEVDRFLALLDEIGQFKDIEVNRGLDNIKLEIDINRELAGELGVDTQIIGNMIKLATNGIIASDYRPDDADDEVDIVARFPEEYRSYDQILRLRVGDGSGNIPLSTVAEIIPEKETGTIYRINSMRSLTVKAEVVDGVLPDNMVKQIRQYYEDNPPSGVVELNFAGEDEEQQEASNFLASAFLIALFTMAIVIALQFNSIYQTVVVMSAVFLSTVGVLIGLMVTNQPFGIVMCGVGIIALAGIVVNNNIIFIDTYNQLRRNEGFSAFDALLHTGVQRLRPILLTAGTTVLGLIPMVFSLTIDFINRDIAVGAPSSQWWVQLSTAIAGGLLFATILTLFFTPSLLMIRERVADWFGRKKNNTARKAIV